MVDFKKVYIERKRALRRSIIELITQANKAKEELDNGENVIGRGLGGLAANVEHDAGAMKLSAEILQFEGDSK